MGELSAQVFDDVGNTQTAAAPVKRGGLVGDELTLLVSVFLYKAFHPYLCR
jgi:hypothetical protein